MQEGADEGIYKNPKRAFENTEMKEGCSNKGAGTVVRKNGEVLLIERMAEIPGFGNSVV